MNPTISDLKKQIRKYKQWALAFLLDGEIEEAIEFARDVHRAEMQICNKRSDKLSVAAERLERSK